MINIYSKSGCSSCIQAKGLCEMMGVDFKYLSLGKDYQLSEFVSIAGSSHKTFPMITVDGEYLGTFLDLQEYLKNI